jgi:hypothetical protein
MLIGSNDNYQRLFWTMGIFVIAVGIFSLLVLKDSPQLKPHKEGTFWQQFARVFNFKSFFQRKELVMVCVTTTVYFISFNVYFVQMGNWLIYHLGFTAANMGLIQGIGLIVAMLVSIPAISLINKNKTPIVGVAAILIDIVGLWILYLFVRPEAVDSSAAFASKNIVMLIAVFLVGAGYILIIQSMTMWLKQLYPEDSRGQFEGIRVLFFTLLPMIIGTTIGNFIIKHGAGTVVNEYGITENIPTESMFMWAAFLVLLAFIPLFYAGKLYYKRINAAKNNG